MATQGGRQGVIGMAGDGTISVDSGTEAALSTLGLDANDGITVQQANQALGKHGAVQSDNVVLGGFLDAISPAPVTTIAGLLGLETGLESTSSIGNVLSGTVDADTAALGDTLGLDAQDAMDAHMAGRMEAHNAHMAGRDTRGGPGDIRRNVDEEQATAGNGLAPGTTPAVSPEEEARRNDYLDWLYGRGQHAPSDMPDMGTVPLPTPVIPATV